MNPLERISPVSDAEAARLTSADTMRCLAEHVTSTAAAAMPGRTARPAKSRHVTRRRVLTGLPLAAGLAVAGLIATSAGAPGQKVGPVNVGPPRAQAAVLTFTRHGRYIDVIVRNPVADARRYRAEFARYHLNITLQLVPASPSIVGTLVAESLSANSRGLLAITAVGKCFTGGGGNVCPVGVRVPLHYKGTATLVFGRAARPGEQYESTTSATAPGEVMHGMHYVGKTVSVVLAELAKRRVTVPQWRVVTRGGCYTAARRSVPGNWHVYQAIPWAPGEVLLWASKTWPLPHYDCLPRPRRTAGATAAPSAQAGTGQG